MELVVNGEPVEFELGNERTVGDFLSSIDSWLNENSFSPLKVFVDERDVTDDRASVQEVSLQDVERVTLEVEKTDILVKTTTEGTLRHITKLNKYCPELLKQFVTGSEKFQSTLQDFLAGIGIISQVVESASVLSGIDLDREKFDGRSIKAWLTNIRTFERGFEQIFSQEDRGRKISYIARDLPFHLGEYRRLYEWILQRIDTKQEEDPLGQAVSILNALRESRGIFEEVATYLQTGDRASGMERLVEAIDLLQGGLKSLHTIVGDEEEAVPVKKFMDGCRSRLNEIVAALETEDMVLLSDLVEYEMGDIAGELISFLEKRVEQSGKKS